MIKSIGNISKVKDGIKELYGSDVFVKVNLGRNKYVTYKGKISGVYPALFTISPTDSFRGKTTYSYAEMMCGNVRIKRADSAK